MSLTGTSYTNTVYLRIGETDIPEIDVPDIYRMISIVVEPLNIPLYVEAQPVVTTWDSEGFDGEVSPTDVHVPVIQLPIKLKTDYLSEDAKGTVTLSLRPIGSLRYFEVDDGSIDLASINFITTAVNVQGIKVNFAAIEGCTHVAITVSGNRY